MGVFRRERGRFFALLLLRCRKNCWASLYMLLQTCLRVFDMLLQTCLHAYMSACVCLQLLAAGSHFVPFADKLKWNKVTRGAGLISSRKVSEKWRLFPKASRLMLSLANAAAIILHRISAVRWGWVKTEPKKYKSYYSGVIPSAYS